MIEEEQRYSQIKNQISPDTDVNNITQQAEIELDLLDCCDEKIENLTIFSQNSSYNYSEFIRENPLIFNKGSSNAGTIHTTPSDPISCTKELWDASELQNTIKNQQLNKSQNGIGILLQSSHGNVSLLHQQTSTVTVKKDFALDLRRESRRKYVVNRYGGIEQPFDLNPGNMSPQSKVYGSMGKVLSNEDLRYLSMRSETPRVGTHSRNVVSKQKIFKENASCFLEDYKEDNLLSRNDKHLKQSSLKQKDTEFGQFLVLPKKNRQTKLIPNNENAELENLEDNSQQQKDLTKQPGSGRKVRVSFKCIKKVNGLSPARRKVILVTKKHLSTSALEEEDDSSNPQTKISPIKNSQEGRDKNIIDVNLLNVQESDNQISDSKKSKLNNSNRKLRKNDSLENNKNNLLQVDGTIQNKRIRKTMSAMNHQRNKNQQLNEENLEEIKIEDSQEVIEKPVKVIQSILKRRSIGINPISPRYYSQKNLSSHKKNVRFNARAQIHEYEKLKDISDSSSSDSQSNDVNYEQMHGIVNEESKNYLYNKKDIELLSQVKKPFHKFIIPPDDPVFKYDYSQIFLKDRDAKKRFYNEFKVCRTYYKKKSRLGFDEKTLKNFKKIYMRKANVPQYTIRADGSKKHTRKTLIFDLDNTLVKSAYKKHKLSDYDSYIYVNILGTKRIRLYLSYRPFVREMLEQLRQDFELILYSAQPKEYTQKAALLLTINPTENYPCVFHHILSKDECIYADDLDIYISDLDILTENRNIKDLIMVTDTFGRTIKHIRNRIPVKSFNGSKKDYSMVALVRYLKGYVRVKDVREKVQSDFKTIDI